MISKFFWTQWRNPTKGDWTETVKQDLKDFKIGIEDITAKSKNVVSQKRGQTMLNHTISH